MGIQFRQTALAGLARRCWRRRARTRKSDTVVLPTIDVSTSRLGAGSTIVGTSSSVITAEDIQQSPAQSLPDILNQQAGIQLQHVSAGANGARDSVDLRGFGASAPSNVLVLVNGRRFNDFDLQGFDFSSIPLNAIERIEITRGNSGAVLYGDGAVGGVINIITKNGVKLPPSARVEGGFGSFRDREGRVSASGSKGPWSAAFDAIGIRTDGYRENGQLRQKGAERRHPLHHRRGQRLFQRHRRRPEARPAGRTAGRPDRRHQPAHHRPHRRGDAQRFRQQAGAELHARLHPHAGAGHRTDRRRQPAPQAAQGELFFAGSPYNGVDTNQTIMSLTPRLQFDGDAGGMPAENPDRHRLLPHAPTIRTAARTLVRRRITSTISSRTPPAVYANGTLAVRPDTDVTLGGRFQQDNISATDTYDPTAPGAFDAQGAPLDRREGQWAAQLGAEHRFNDMFAVFGHVAHAFRVPNADERIGLGTPTNFDLRTQTSNEIEGGARLHLGRFKLQSSVYDMELNDEIFFSPATFTNINLDPTRHWGVETTASLALSDTVSLHGNVTYTRATFREGTFAGNDIPLISRWTGNAGLTWDIWRKWFVYDVMLHYAGERRLDNDSANVQPLIPAHTVVDMRIGGQIPVADHVKNAFWSFTVQNLFNDMYYDYGIASTTTIGRFNAYPQPGRTFMFRAGVELE